MLWRSIAEAIRNILYLRRPHKQKHAARSSLSRSCCAAPGINHSQHSMPATHSATTIKRHRPRRSAYQERQSVGTLFQGTHPEVLERVREVPKQVAVVVPTTPTPVSTVGTGRSGAGQRCRCTVSRGASSTGTCGRGQHADTHIRADRTPWRRTNFASCLSNLCSRSTPSRASSLLLELSVDELPSVERSASSVLSSADSALPVAPSDAASAFCQRLVATGKKPTPKTHTS